jgi:hypothetical protein
MPRLKAGSALKAPPWLIQSAHGAVPAAHAQSELASAVTSHERDDRRLAALRDQRDGGNSR